MYQLKVMLNDIIDYAFPDDPRRKAYKAFYIQVLEKNYKGKHGDYSYDKRLIRLMNPYRDEKKLVVTSIHELAHHVNHMQGNTDIHGNGFYNNFRILLYSALDMNLFNKEEYIELVKESNDSSSGHKVAKMIQDYVPKNVGYKKDLLKIFVFGGYEIKENLKSNGYRFNKLGKAWEKEIEEANRSYEECWLKGLDVEYKITEANRYIVKSENQRVEKKYYIFHMYNSYEYRNELKSLGMRFLPDNKVWEMKIEANQRDTRNQIDSFVYEIRKMGFAIVKNKKYINGPTCLYFRDIR